MFLDWLPQIVSRFRFNETCFLDNLLIRLATEYPAALVYTFQLSFAQFTEQNPFQRRRPVVQQILDALKNGTVETFISAVKCLNAPEKVIKAHVALLKIALNEKYPNDVYKRTIKSCYDTVFENRMRCKLNASKRNEKAIIDIGTNLKELETLNGNLLKILIFFNRIVILILFICSFG